MDGQCHMVGEPIIGPHPAVFKLVISDHVPLVNPRDYGIDRDGIDPAKYFITSGDAVEKAKVLDRDLWRLAGNLRKELFALIAAERQCDITKAAELFKSGERSTQFPRFHEYEADVWRAAGQCRKLINALKIARKDAIFLETEWNDRVLYCIPKNPRK